MEWKTVEIKDENGECFETLRCEDLVFPKQFVHMNPEQRMQDIKNFKYLDGDVMICSYPKTGTHWVHSLVRFMMTPGPVNDLLVTSPCLLDLHPLEKTEEQPSPRLITTHLQPRHLPAEHVQGRGKIILLVRNPRDTVVSHMYHCQRNEVFNYSRMSWNCFFENWIQGNIPTGSYFDYYNSWQKAVSSNKSLNLLIVRYENIIKDGLAEMRRMQEFLGVSNSDDRLKEILERFSYKRLNVDPRTGKVLPPGQEGEVQLFKKGVIGHWKNQFTVAQEEIFRTVLQEKFASSMFLDAE